MNKTETVLLCRYAKAMCPAQAIDEYTPDAWADVLDDVDLEDAKKAIRVGIRERHWRFIDVTDVIELVRSARRARLDAYFRRFGHPIPPASLDEDTRAGARWLAVAQGRIAAGEVDHPDQLNGLTVDDSLPVRDVIAELGTIGRTVPATDSRGEVNS